MPIALYIATGNAGKLREIEELVHVYFPGIFAPVTGRAPRSAEETEHTFRGNAQIKSLALEQELVGEGRFPFAVLSDDSGLSVDLLGGKPGVHSARYAGDHVDSRAHIDKLLTELGKNPDAGILENRKAHYTCALDLVIRTSSHRHHWSTLGECHGLIDFKLSGVSGFGYDPVFWVPEFSQSFGDLPFDTKNRISHRQRAFEALKVEAESFLWNQAKSPRSAS